MGRVGVRKSVVESIGRSLGGKSYSIVQLLFLLVLNILLKCYPLMHNENELGTIKASNKKVGKIGLQWRNAIPLVLTKVSNH